MPDFPAFQLFWSKNAAQDSQVTKELNYALSLKKEGFIKPVYWEEPIAKVPKRLSNLWFSKIELIRITETIKQSIQYNIDQIEKFSVTNNYTNMGDQYNVNQAGAVGPNSSASNNVFNQLNSSLPESTNYEQLTTELYDLRNHLLTKASLPEHYIAIGEVAKAEEAAKSKDGNKVIKFLAAAGKWVLVAAKDIGTDVLSEVIKKQIGV